MIVNEPTFYVSEIFESIQGEGNYSGVYCLFVRFQFCNLTCHWCDTKYTWNARSGKYKNYTAGELKALIGQSQAHHIVFTGGEPCLYRLDLLHLPCKKFHVETNGCYLPPEPLNFRQGTDFLIERDAMNWDIAGEYNWVVSPKLSNSYQDFPHKTFAWWVKNTGCIFKFIISDAPDLDEVDALVRKYNIDKQRIYAGIEGFTLNSQLQPRLVESIISHNYNFSPRLHVMLWGNIKGK